jgi:glycosyltransferase involved in cell wall biosynthesis
MKIAIVVHGRFHAFDLARSLLERGHEVVLFTNYPKWAVARFGIDACHVRSFWFHGVLTRLVNGIHERVPIPTFEAELHSMFSRWAAAQVKKSVWDVVHCWSGVAEDILREPKDKGTLWMMVRASSHICTQAHLLEEEERRTHIPLERPSAWRIAREEREYALADQIVVLSRFSYDSFVDEGVPAEKLRIMLPGVQHSSFRATPQMVEARCRRILAGEPLRVINIGTASLRKGMWDMVAVIQALRRSRFEFRFVGPVTVEMRNLIEDLSPATFIPRQPQQQLPTFYAWGDIFVLPTIEDGFPYVLNQAAAAALPILTTPNGAGEDLVRNDESGWVLPIRTPEAFIERLRWCDTHREKLVMMIRRVYETFRPRDWTDMAADFEMLCNELRTSKPAKDVGDAKFQ